MGRRPKSAITEDMTHCYICGSPYTQVHHIFGASRKKMSEKYRYLVPLCVEHHTGSYGVHNDRTLDLFIKGTAQKHFEENIGTREDWRAIFGKSWL